MSDVDLSSYDDAYQKAKPMGESPPDGDYRVRVEKVEIKTSKAAGNPMLNWQLAIEHGPEVGRRLFHRHMLNKAEGLGRLKADLKICGIEMAKLNELHSKLPKLLDLKLHVRKKTNGDYENVYFVALLDDGEGEPPHAPQPDYGEVPF